MTMLSTGSSKQASAAYTAHAVQMATIQDALQRCDPWPLGLPVALPLEGDVRLGVPMTARTLARQQSDGQKINK